MKKGYIYKCEKCGFEANEKNKLCPMCNNEMVKTKGENKNINPTLPKQLNPNTKRDVQLTYYCFKCRKEMKTKVCLHCNNVGSLILKYNGKVAVINRITHLTEVFTDEEINVIMNQLTEQEKYYIYHNYESAYRFFYKRDKMKSIACYIFAIILYIVFLDVTFSMVEKEYIFVSYFSNMIGNAIFAILCIIGVWYMFDATNVEFKKVPMKVGTVVTIPNLMQLAYVIVKGSEIKEILISGYIAIVASILIYVIYFLLERQYEK